MENKMPVVMATDVNTDIGRIAEANDYGMWVESGNPEKYLEMVDSMVIDRSLIKTMGGREATLICVKTIQYRVVIK